MNQKLDDFCLNESESRRFSHFYRVPLNHISKWNLFVAVNILKMIRIQPDKKTVSGSLTQYLVPLTLNTAPAVAISGKLISGRYILNKHIYFLYVFSCIKSELLTIKFENLCYAPSRRCQIQIIIKAKILWVL